MPGCWPVRTSNCCATPMSATTRQSAIDIDRRGAWPSRLGHACLIISEAAPYVGEGRQIRQVARTISIAVLFAVDRCAMHAEGWYSHPPRACLQAGVCPCCWRQFHTRGRLAAFSDRQRPKSCRIYRTYLRTWRSWIERSWCATSTASRPCLLHAHQALRLLWGDARARTLPVRGIQGLDRPHRD